MMETTLHNDDTIRHDSVVVAATAIDNDDDEAIKTEEEDIDDAAMTKSKTTSNTSKNKKCSRCNKRSSNDGCINKLCYNCCCMTMNDSVSQGSDNKDDSNINNNNIEMSNVPSQSQSRSQQRCEVHYKQYTLNQWKEQVLNGTTPIQIRAQQLRQIQLSQSRSVHCKGKKSFFYERNFLYQGDTVIIWNKYDYYHRIYKKSFEKCTNSGNINTTTTLSILPNRRREMAIIKENNCNNNNNTTKRLRINRKRFYRIMNELYIRNKNSGTMS